jgi:CheY-like chemotaxis protein
MTATAQHVLIANDEPNRLRFFRTYLESAGFRVSGSKNGQAALERLQSEPDIDLLITDVMIPEMDGFELLRTVRGIPALASLPVIVAGAMPADVAFWEQNGEVERQRRRDWLIADYGGPLDFLVVPFAPAVLVEMAVRMLAERSHERPAG